MNNCIEETIMPTPRKDQIDLNVTRYYHCLSRCVRRAYLCGFDQKTQRDFDHRKQWLVELMHQFSNIFAIRICSYTVMSNHYHLVLYVNPDLAESWSDQDIFNRWAAVYPTAKDKNWSDLDVDFLNLSDAQQQDITQWRGRLYSISWFMRKLNESIARLANKEDNCTGHFWESRFKSQALLDESALLACMAYVDLNPIRAGISHTPETSDFTSIQERIQAYQQHQPTVDTLCPFTDEIESDEASNSIPEGIVPEGVVPCSRQDYFELVDRTGRVLKKDKAGAIPADLAPILERIQINPKTWIHTVQFLGDMFARFIGRPDKIEEQRAALKKPRLYGLKSAEQAFTIGA